MTANSTGLHSPLGRIVIAGIVCLVVVALIGLATAPAAATSLRAPELDVTAQCEPSLDTVSVAGQPHSVREDYAMLFTGADEVAPHVDSVVAGYPVPERHAQLFAIADTESLTVGSAIAGYPAREAHAILFAGAETEPLTGEAASADCPSG